MAYWHEKVEKYPGDGALAAILMMYLSLGPDYPYHIAKTFLSAKDENESFALKIYETKGCRSLFNHSALPSKMRDMRRDGLLVSKVDETKPRNPSVYSLNPEVLRAPTDTLPYKMGNGNGFEIPMDLIEDHLNWLKTMTKDNGMERMLFLSPYERYDHISFLVFHKNFASDRERGFRDAGEGNPSIGEDEGVKLSELIEVYLKEIETLPNVVPRRDILKFLKEAPNSSMPIMRDQRDHSSEVKNTVKEIFGRWIAETLGEEPKKTDLKKEIEKILKE